MHLYNKPINEVVISIEYDDFFEKGIDDYILSIDKVRFQVTLPIPRHHLLV